MVGWVDFGFSYISFIVSTLFKRKIQKYYDIFPHLNKAFTKIHSITNPYIEDNDAVEKDITILRLFVKI